MIDCYSDIDNTYEQLASSLRMLGFDWEKAHAKGIEGHCSLMTSPNPKSQKCFSLPPNGRMQNGQSAIEFGVLSGIWQGIQGTLIQISAGTGGKNWFMMGLHCVDNKIYFKVIPALDQ